MKNKQKYEFVTVGGKQHKIRVIPSFTKEEVEQFKHLKWGPRQQLPAINMGRS